MMLKTLSVIFAGAFFVWAFFIGMEKEAVRQCEVAMAHCEQYGACSAVDLESCKGE